MADKIKTGFIDETDIAPLTFQDIDDIDNVDVSGGTELPDDYVGDISDEDIWNIINGT